MFATGSFPARKIEPVDWLTGGNLLLRKGKKDYALLRTEGRR